MTLSLNLDTRSGWPEDLRFLLERYPREVWPTHRNLGETARFWLSRHAMFRELGGMLQAGTAEFRNGVLSPQEFHAWFAPGLQFFLSQLEGHHQIEDLHYFPLFRHAEARLVRGFDVLEQDHELIHREILSVVEAANGLIRRLEGGGDALHRAADTYADVNDRLLKSLLRHLDDEEDLIVPVVLDRGEERLGLQP